MSSVLDTASIPPRDREEVVRNAVWESMVAVDIDHGPPTEDIAIRIGLGSVGPLRICSARSTPVTLRRTERLAREDQEPAVTLGVQMRGSSVVVQNDREALLGPGDCAVYESIAPYSLLFDEGVDHRFIRFPRAALALPDRLLRDITAVPLGSENPVARLAFTAVPESAHYEHRPTVADAIQDVASRAVRAVRAVAEHQLGLGGYHKVPPSHERAAFIR